ncbi:hypothetical protein BJY16_005668 [Actinoplanes octamycinicus]|uniref:STAS domain-containing protein n=1 Tax=Actinoplanes octamycinicus TaxID=135948 RepID=A0A7W7H1G4_9ACTN|nr:MEDS domain-containing protein [Actinoplanes octamycinicus]MBB4742209.1 hypothetical protein [Actinoplanes octamycinicus]GIE59945.1 hypothetical protein Aoc01nite_53470 [Actinoplanes octamycinicus]
MATTLFDRLRPGDHVCLIGDDDVLQARGIAQYIRAGLRERQRVVFYGDRTGLLDQELAAAGVDTGDACGSGQLQIISPGESYLASGRFDPDATIAAWRTEEAITRAAGFDGLRVGGDMGWAARPVPGADLLGHYEAQVNRVFADGFVTAVCFYDRRLFPHAELRHLSCAHPATATAGPEPDTAPQLRMLRTVDPPGIRLSGEADLANRAALSAVMRALADDTPDGSGPLTVDVHELRYADASAARFLMYPAVHAGRPLRVVGCSRALRRMLTLQGSDGVPGLLVETDR